MRDYCRILQASARRNNHNLLGRALGAFVLVRAGLEHDVHGRIMLRAMAGSGLGATTLHASPGKIVVEDTFHGIFFALSAFRVILPPMILGA